MNKIRVCIITGGHWAAVMGGAQYQAKCLLSSMCDDEQLELIYLARAVDPKYIPESYKIIQIAKPVGIRRHGFFFDFFKLYNLLKKIKPDVIYQRGLQPYTGYSAYYAKRNKCKFIFHIAHAYDVTPFSNNKLSLKHVFKFVEKIIGEYGLRNANKIISQTQFQANELSKNYRLNANIIIPNFHPYPIDEISKNNSQIKVVWVANFKSIKQPEKFVKLAQDLRAYEDVSFMMIGRPGDKKEYSNLHRIINKTDNLNYLGEKTIDEVNNILANAHIFVNTSQSEGFANTFIQAWMRKVPVVSMYVNTDDNFDNNKTGIFGGSYDGLKEGVEKLVKDEKLRNEMGDYAQKYAFQYHSMKNAKKLVSIIKDKNF